MYNWGAWEVSSFLLFLFCSPLLDGPQVCELLCPIISLVSCMPSVFLVTDLCFKLSHSTLPLGVCLLFLGYLINSSYNGRGYLSTLWKSIISGKEPGFLADCNQKDHCPVNKITFVPHLNGMFKGTLCPRASTMQERAQAFRECSWGRWHCRLLSRTLWAFDSM